MSIAFMDPRRTVAKSLVPLIVGVSSLASPAFAAVKDQTRKAEKAIWPGMRLEKGSPYAHIGLRDLARCLVVERPQQTRAILAENDPSKRAALVTELFADKKVGYCSSRIVLRFGQHYFRGAMIEYLYLKDFGQGAPRAASVRLGVSDADLRLAECVVEAQTSETEKLLGTEPKSYQQSRIYGRLEKTIGDCADRLNVRVPEPQLFRLQIAESLYRKASQRVATGRSPGGIQ